MRNTPWKSFGCLPTDPRIVQELNSDPGRARDASYGAWNIDPLEEPERISTISHRELGTQEVDGLGWYCYITHTKLYKEANYHYEGTCLGPDVCYTLDLRRQGYKALLDWGVPCTHRARHGDLKPSKDVKVTHWIKERGEWVIDSII